MTATDLMARAVDHHRAGRLDGASALYRRLLEEEPTHDGALALYGALLVQRASAGEALPFMKRALALSPAAGPTHTNLGEAQRLLGRLPRSIENSRRAIAIDATDVEAQANLGLALTSLGNAAAATPYLRSALILDPRHHAALNTLGNANVSLGRIAAARNLFRRSLAADPGYVPAEINLASTDLLLGAPRDARRRLLRLADAGVRDAGLDSDLLFTYAYDPDATNIQLYEAYRRWARRHSDDLRTDIRPFSGTREPGRRLRVGYLSADLRSHPIAQLLEGVLAHHDARTFETVCFADIAAPDHVTARLRRLASEWHDVTGLATRSIADRIRSSSIDVLVIVAGHTSGNHIRVATAKPAPIVVNFHDLSTSGLDTVDYWLTDRALHPPGSDEGRSERLWYLPSLYLHKPPADAPEPGIRDPGLGDPVVFGSFNNPAKINDAVLRLWARVLRRVPGSRLVLGYRNLFDDNSLGSRVRDRLGADGIAPERLILAPDAPSRSAHLARVSEVDIALDPFPFNGGITTFEALWMGVPVITLAGVRFAARGGVSHLDACGLTELIATGAESYIEIAASLAADRARLMALRRSLRDKVAASPLCDGAMYTAHLEQAYRSMWQTWCSGTGDRTA